MPDTTHAPADDAPSGAAVMTEEPREPSLDEPGLDDAAQRGSISPAASLGSSIEAVLVTRSKPIGVGSLVRGLGLVGDDGTSEDADAAAGAVRAAVDALNEAYESTGRAFRIERVAGGLRLVTLAEHAGVIERFQPSENEAGLSRAAIETLAIIAYRQPITRAQIEAIRGVACGEVVRRLMERRLIEIVGRAEELGRPMLYGTTRQFLQAFGLSSIQDLPKQE